MKAFSSVGAPLLEEIALPLTISLLQQLKGLLFDECRRNGFKFVDNGAVSESDLWTDGIRMIESGKHIIANNLINSLN